MAGEIAYKLSAEEKQAVDAIRKVAEAYAKVEGGVKKVSEETKKAQKEQEEMGRMAKRIMEEARTPAERYAEQMSKLEQLFRDGKIDLDAFNGAAKKAHDQMISAGKKTEDAFGPKAMGMVRTLAGALGVGGLLYTAVSALKGEFQSLIDIQERVKSASLSTADAEATAIQNLGPKDKRDIPEMLKKVEGISIKTGVSEKQLFGVTAEALAGRGDLPVARVYEAVEAAATMAPESEDKQRALAGAAMDLQKILPGTAKQSIGYLMEVAKRSRVTDIGEVGRTLAPAVTAAIASGSSEMAAGAAYAAITQGAVDIHGRRSKTAGIALFTQLEKYLPAEGEQYSEADYQRDKEKLSRERTEKERQRQRSALQDPEYLREMSAIDMEKAKLPGPRRQNADPALFAVHEAKLRILEDRRRKAFEDAESRSKDLPEFAGMQEEFALREQELSNRRETAKNIVYSGFDSVDARISYLQQNPEAAKKFLKLASFESAAEIPARQLVTGRGKTADAYHKFFQEIPLVIEGDQSFDENVSYRQASPRQQTADFNRRMVSARERMEAMPEMQAKAKIASLMTEYKPLLEDVGESRIFAKFSEVGARLSSDEITYAQKIWRQSNGPWRPHMREL